MERVDEILLAFLSIKCYENPSGDSRSFIYLYAETSSSYWKCFWNSLCELARNAS